MALRTMSARCVNLLAWRSLLWLLVVGVTVWVLHESWNGDVYFTGKKYTPTISPEDRKRIFLEQLQQVGGVNSVAVQRQKMFMNFSEMIARHKLNGIGDAVWIPELGVPVIGSVWKQLKEMKKQAIRPANESEVRKTLHIVEKTWKKFPPTTSKKYILLVSTWRSGSTFVGQILAHQPGVFQHYEPLSYIGVRQVRNKTDEQSAQTFISELLSCNFANKQYLNHTFQNLIDMVGHNVAIWEACRQGPNKNACANQTFLHNSCIHFPIHVMKLVRLRLRHVQRFLESTQGDYKVVYLVRDPRGTMASRYSSVKWCHDSKECILPEVLCKDLDNDISMAQQFSAHFPDKFRVLQYEDVAKYPQEIIFQLFQFLGLPYTDETDNLVRTFTEKNDNAPWSVRRKSSERIDRWKETLNPDQVGHINSACQNVISTLGY